VSQPIEKNYSLEEENGREQQANNSFSFFFFFLSYSLSIFKSHDARRRHHAASHAVGSIPTAVVGLAAVRERVLYIHTHTHIHSVPCRQRNMEDRLFFLYRCAPMNRHI